MVWTVGSDHQFLDVGRTVLLPRHMSAAVSRQFLRSFHTRSIVSWVEVGESSVLCCFSRNCSRRVSRAAEYACQSDFSLIRHALWLTLVAGIVLERLSAIKAKSGRWSEDRE